MSQPYDFMTDRLDVQIKYYSKQSDKNKKKYFTSQTIIIVLGIIIPVVNFIAISGFGLTNLFLFISTILASVIGFTAALSQLNKHYETWLNYRSTLELLKREKSLYQNSAGGYFNLNEVDKKRAFVDRVEELLSSEHTKFFSTFQQQMDSLQYVKDILTKVNDLKSLDVTNNSKDIKKAESSNKIPSTVNPIAQQQQATTAAQQQQQQQQADTTVKTKKDAGP